MMNTYFERGLEPYSGSRYERYLLFHHFWDLENCIYSICWPFISHRSAISVCFVRQLLSMCTNFRYRYHRCMLPASHVPCAVHFCHLPFCRQHYSSSVPHGSKARAEIYRPLVLHTTTLRYISIHSSQLIDVANTRGSCSTSPACLPTFTFIHQLIITVDRFEQCPCLHGCFLLVYAVRIMGQMRADGTSIECQHYSVVVDMAGLRRCCPADHPQKPPQTTPQENTALNGSSV